MSKIDNRNYQDYIGNTTGAMPMSDKISAGKNSVFKLAQSPQSQPQAQDQEENIQLFADPVSNTAIVTRSYSNNPDVVNAGPLWVGPTGPFGSTGQFATTFWASYAPNGPTGTGVGVPGPTAIQYGYNSNYGNLTSYGTTGINVGYLGQNARGIVGSGLTGLNHSMAFIFGPINVPSDANITESYITFKAANQGPTAGIPITLTTRRLDHLVYGTTYGWPYTLFTTGGNIQAGLTAHGIFTASLTGPTAYYYGPTAWNINASTMLGDSNSLNPVIKNFLSDNLYTPGTTNLALKVSGFNGTIAAGPTAVANDFPLGVTVDGDPADASALWPTLTIKYRITQNQPSDLSITVESSYSGGSVTPRPTVTIIEIPQEPTVTGSATTPAYAHSTTRWEFRMKGEIEASIRFNTNASEGIAGANNTIGNILPYPATTLTQVSINLNRSYTWEVRYAPNGMPFSRWIELDNPPSSIRGLVTSDVQITETRRGATIVDNAATVITRTNRGATIDNR